MNEAVGGLNHATVRDDDFLNNIPLELLRAELSRRQDVIGKPACGSGSGPKYYNTPLHVFALVMILVVSTLACSFPIIARRFPSLPIPHRFLFLSRHFGTGVLIATAFVHLLPTAFVSLTDACLPSFWNEGYPAMPGFIAMMAVFIVVGIEMFFATRGAGHMHGSEYEVLSEDHEDLPILSGHVHRPSLHSRKGSIRTFDPASGYPNPDDFQLDTLSSTSTPLATPFLANHNQSTKPYANHTSLEADNPSSPSSSTISVSYNASNPFPNTSTRRLLPQEQTARKALLQVVLLEAGILFHSVFIGMALSVTTGTPFIVLLIAISFHQTFEGLALGSRIGGITFPHDSYKPWLMALAYGGTTPVGQAIGLAVHNLYDPEGEVGLLMVGVMNAISSGLLLFAGLVELLAEDFLTDRSYESLKGWRRLEACASVVAGSLLMALVGAWA
ncbi:MAG: hypothetical protein M1834_001641 [Cirrosporium novae-zelandiae]|nr:MAG: hypothetical protein M1834_004158 [Cirrosporium novae-zelandiae]KAI9735625.1 MAG: hypothetical protein M1834_001641 [Cirrosporium novae-zelandiae]